MTDNTCKAVFLDRDGVINVDTGYIKSVEAFQLYSYSVNAIKRLNEAGFKVIVVTNQSGIARGLYTEKTLKDIHDTLELACVQAGAWIDAIYYCPHHPEESACLDKRYHKQCQCRKPGTGMIEQACAAFNINCSKSYLVGDSITDIQAGDAMGLTTVGVETGNGVKGEVEPDMMLENLEEAVSWVLKER